MPDSSEVETGLLIRIQRALMTYTFCIILVERVLLTGTPDLVRKIESSVDEKVNA